MSRTIKSIDKTVSAFERTIDKLLKHAQRAEVEAELHSKSIAKAAASRAEVLSAGARAERVASNLSKLVRGE